MIEFTSFKDERRASFLYERMSRPAFRFSALLWGQETERSTPMRLIASSLLAGLLTVTAVAPAFADNDHRRKYDRRDDLLL